MTDRIYWSFYLIPLSITAICMLLYIVHGLYLGYRRRLRALLKSGGGALDGGHLKIVLPTREDWGWSPAFATALLLLGLVVFATAANTPLRAAAPMVGSHIMSAETAASSGTIKD